MKATLLVQRRIIYAENAFAALSLWSLPKPLPASHHAYKYRLAYVVKGRCVLRYDNETGKGDHRHIAGVEEIYHFTTPERLLADFRLAIERWNHENPDP
jgi:hypothetical protein